MGAAAHTSIFTQRLQLCAPEPTQAEAVLDFFERNRAHLAPWEPPRDAAFYNLDFQRDRLHATAEALADLNDVLRARLGDAAAGLAIAAPGFDGPAEERLPALSDAAGEFAAAYGAVPGTAWLIRTDGHIGWAGVSPLASVFARALDRCLGLVVGAG